MSQKPQGTRFHVEGDERYMEVPVYDQAEGSREQLVTKLLIGSGVAGVVLLVAGLQFSNNLLIVAGGILIALLYIVALKSIAKQKHYKAVRIHTDEIQLWDGYELEWAIPTSQLASVDIDTKVLWTIRTYDGRQFQFYLLPASLPDWSAAIRTLAPHAWPQGKGRRLWERVSVYRGKWMLLIGTLLMMPAAFLVAWAAVVALCLGSLIAGVGILLLAGGIDYRRELESESKQGKLSAEDMLRVWPIMDSEVKVYSYSDPRRLLLRSRRFSFGIWVFRILMVIAIYYVIKSGFGSLSGVGSSPHEGAISALPRVVILYVVVLPFCCHLWAFVEKLKWQAQQLSKLRSARLKMQDRSISLEYNGGQVSLPLEAVPTLTGLLNFQAAHTAVRTLKVGERKFLLWTDLMVEEATEESVVEEGVVSEDDDAKDVSELRAT